MYSDKPAQRVSPTWHEKARSDAMSKEFFRAVCSPWVVLMTNHTGPGSDEHHSLPEKLARMAASELLSDAAIRFKLGRAPPSESLTHSNSAARAFGHQV
ncbi:hypothetical protein PCANC_11165 [Puccinia coronata f. sp. avenae]|uniref:Uncharacterized protein n=1 Tax=Puccinia coronata f. sp. avenae TaxID=200324 RepID=A0A2N5URB8_9BASI|nr:hypothetical protein PCANC_11165 [Puccinia coronata f. sp. avenae]